MPRVRWHVPGLKKLDWYIIRQFLSTYVFLILIIISIAIVFDYNEHIDKFSRANLSFPRIFMEYYIYFIPYYTNLFSALFVFVAVIFFTTKLAGNSEIIAMKAAGVSFRRLLRPYMVSAALIAALTFYLGGYVIPKGNVARVDFENKYTKKKNSNFADNIQMHVEPGVVCFITHFDNRTKSGYGFSLDKFQGKRVVSRLTAQTIRYDTLSDKRYKWSLQMYQIRTQRGMKEEVEQGSKLDTIIQVEPRDFFYVLNQQETMTLPELDEFVDRQRARGAAGVAAFEVEYHKRFAAPFAAFILTLIGACLSSEKRKGGMGASIGLGLALSFAYILFQTISASFAINAGWPVLLSVWLPNIVFAVIALVLYRRTPM
ncbi:MAG: LptF/LptG family permease [Alloprevotella sp.]|nr:LptF/LptG family permease [Alloprevotella sp.]MBR1652206.1 LptF/LptG family permease [Alloprevotella sp.]